jgi:lipoic acid synthetase
VALYPTVVAVGVGISRFDGSGEVLEYAKPAPTVERLQKPVRKRARYDRSLGVLRDAKQMASEMGHAVHTKSSLMVGLGETRDELQQTFVDLRAVDCDILTIGQYLRPTENHLPMSRYYTPKEFASFKKLGFEMGFKHVESGPLVRSSFHAHEQTEDASKSGALGATV